MTPALHQWRSLRGGAAAAALCRSTYSRTALSSNCVSVSVKPLAAPMARSSFIRTLASLTLICSVSTAVLRGMSEILNIYVAFLQQGLTYRRTWYYSIVIVVPCQPLIRRCVVAGSD